MREEPTRALSHHSSGRGHCWSEATAVTGSFGSLLSKLDGLLLLKRIDETKMFRAGHVSMNYLRGIMKNHHDVVQTTAEEARAVWYGTGGIVVHDENFLPKTQDTFRFTG